MSHPTAMNDMRFVKLQHPPIGPSIFLKIATTLFHWKRKFSRIVADFWTQLSYRDTPGTGDGLVLHAICQSAPFYLHPPLWIYLLVVCALQGGVCVICVWNNNEALYYYAGHSSERQEGLNYLVLRPDGRRVASAPRPAGGLSLTLFICISRGVME